MADADYTVTSRNCTKCGEEKSLNNFSKAKRGKYGRASVCRACWAKYAAKRYRDNIEEYKAKYKEIYQAKRRVQLAEREKKRAALIAQPDKQCSKCKATKPKSEFPRQSKSFDGLRPRCKACHNADNRAWERRNPEAAKAAANRWRSRNKEWISIRARRWQEANIEHFKEKAKEWREKNPDKRKAAWDRYRARPEVRAHRSISTRIRSSLLDGKSGRKTFEALGYTRDELIAHIERQFTKGMSWDNYGEWHIDHIIPASSLRYTSMEDPEFRACWALSNLRPLWAEENMRKHAQILHLI